TVFVRFQHLALCCSFPSIVPPTSVISILSLHDALPISEDAIAVAGGAAAGIGLAARRQDDALGAEEAPRRRARHPDDGRPILSRSEEHTSELQSRGHLVCRLLLEKKKWSSLRVPSRFDF